jgi:AcrR family transcriptional regulator
MIENDNSVNIKSAKPRYHHGDLRASLVAAGLDLLKSRTVDDLSLREVARTVGVSATAVYRHFPDKQALLYALCEEGGEQLGRSQIEAARQSGGGKKGFGAAGCVYVRFAHANPALFRLIMSTKPPGSLLDGELTAVGSAMRLLREGVAALLPPDADHVVRRSTAVHAWSLVHGLAMLILDGQVEYDEGMIEQVVAGSVP